MSFFAGRGCLPVRVTLSYISSTICCLPVLGDLFSTLSCHRPRVLLREQQPKSLTENLRRFTDLGALRCQQGRAWPEYDVEGKRTREEGRPSFRGCLANCLIVRLGGEVHLVSRFYDVWEREKEERSGREWTAWSLARGSGGVRSAPGRLSRWFSRWKGQAKGRRFLDGCESGACHKD